MWRIIDISGDNYRFVFSQNNFVAVKDGEERLRAHLSDINCIIVHSYSVSYSGVLLQKLLEYNVPLVLCDRFHNPCGILLANFLHSEYGNRINAQINASLPLRKKAWKNIVAAKILNQAGVLSLMGRKDACSQLQEYADDVKSGDATNREGAAARIYFPSLFDNFKRDKNSEDIINSSLNYAYAILRSNTARAIVGSGLNPALGIFHSHKQNPLCLVDDLMEPLRPFADLYVKNNVSELRDKKFLDSETKNLLSGIIKKSFKIGKEKYSVLAGTQKYVQSYISFLMRNSSKIEIPRV